VRPERSVKTSSCLELIKTMENVVQEVKAHGAQKSLRSDILKYAYVGAWACIKFWTRWKPHVKTIRYI
jgi:hypothetical protein